MTKIDDEKPQRRHVFDDPKNVRRVIRGLFFACAALLGADLVIHRHIENPMEALFGFYAFFGFIACVLLVLLAKELRKVLMRREDYYDPVDD